MGKCINCGNEMNEQGKCTSCGYEIETAEQQERSFKDLKTDNTTKAPSIRNNKGLIFGIAGIFFFFLGFIFGILAILYSKNDDHPKLALGLGLFNLIGKIALLTIAFMFSDSLNEILGV